MRRQSIISLEDYRQTNSKIEPVSPAKKILTLNFLNISNYSKDIKGILAFEEDLLKDAIK